MARRNINANTPPIIWSTIEQAFDDINANFTEVYLNISGTDSTDPVDLTSLTTDLIPKEASTYDLGSEIKMWSKLFVDDYISLDGALISINGSGSIDLPSGSTVDGDLIRNPAEGSFKTISISGQDDVEATGFDDTLNLIGAGVGITTTAASNSITFTNSGVTSLTASTGISLDSGTGDITVTNSGVTALTGGLGISVDASTGSITLDNDGIVSVSAGSGIIVSARDPITGDITITNSAPNVVQFTFRTIAVSGQNDIVADSATDTLSFANGDGINITTDDASDVITIANTGVTNLSGSTGISVSGSTGSVTLSNTGVTSLTGGSGISVDSSTGSVTITNTRPGFTSVAVAGQDPLLADTVTDTLVLAEGLGISLTTDAGTDSLTISVDTDVLYTRYAIGDDSTTFNVPLEQTLVITNDQNISIVGDSSGSITVGLNSSITADLSGSVFADDSTLLVDGVAGTVVGPLNSSDGASFVTMSALSGLQLISTGGVELSGAASAEVNIGIGTSGNVTIGSGTNNVKIDVDSLELNITNVPGASTGQNGDKQGMIAFDATSIYYCIADWAAPGTADIWVKQDWGTTGSW